MRLTIGWLYGTKMNIYGDRGNIIALERRARWRGIDAETREIGIGDPVSDAIDLFFFGGGQDQEQEAIARDLQGAKGATIRRVIEDGAAALTVCGGYQLFGHEYRPHGAPALPGIGLFDLTTEAGPERFIGNVIVETTFGELVGFENHSGLTWLGPNATPLGRVRIGRGNNGKDGTEGAIWRNAIGCYLHGSLLPKNPHLTDWLLARALERRHGAVALPPLDDRHEIAAHASARERAARTR